MTKSSEELVATAQSVVESITVAELKQALSGDAVAVVDVRDASELTALAPLESAIHASRGMLEFHIDPDSDFHISVFAETKPIVFVCGSGGRASLAAMTAREMGVTGVQYLEGGMKAWKAAAANTANKDSS